VRQILVKANLEELSIAAADLFLDIAGRAIDERGRLSVALSGGTTPASLYKLLASESYRDSVDWERVFFFFGDERNVPHTDAESNYRMVKETLFATIPVGSEQVHAWPVDCGSPQKIADEYERQIEHFFDGPPIFDLVLLGLGDDCHTASLFPGTDALSENLRMAVAHWVEKLSAFRLTMTFPVFNNASNVMFLVAGKSKAKAVATVLEADFRPDDFPAQFVNPGSGNLYWILDESAASLLANE
jgi:6-phosphogluconolactonase